MKDDTLHAGLARTVRLDPRNVCVCVCGLER